MLFEVISFNSMLDDSKESYDCLLFTLQYYKMVDIDIDFN